MDAHTLAKLTGASALRGLTGRFSPVRGTGPYAYRISITPTFLQLKPYALTLHSITVRGTGNDSRESLAPSERVHPARLVLSSAFVQAQCFGFCRMLLYCNDRACHLCCVYLAHFAQLHNVHCT